MGQGHLLYNNRTGTTDSSKRYYNSSFFQGNEEHGVLRSSRRAVISSKSRAKNAECYGLERKESVSETKASDGENQNSCSIM